MHFTRAALVASALAATLLSGCSGDAKPKASTSTTPSSSQTSASASPTPSETPRRVPGAGKGNIQGAVFYKDAPAAGVTVDVCEKFAQFLSQCSGKVVSFKTGADGVFVSPDLTPGTYQALLVHVFATNRFIYHQQSQALSVSYSVFPGQTVFVPRTDLWKADLVAVSPRAGSKIAGAGLKLVWQAYPDAAYYKVTLTGAASTGFANVSDVRVDGATSYAVTTAVPAGTYKWHVEAYTAKDTKFAIADPVSFTVTTPATAPSPAPS